MVFSAPIFLFAFLPLVVAAWLIFRRSKVVLLVASLAFYAWGVASGGQPYYFWLLIGVILWNYWIGERIGHAPGRSRKFVLFAGVAIDLIVLIAFKYAAFLAGTLNAALGTSWPEPRPEAVLGISFFTFQAVAYLADIYKGEIEPAGSLFRFALFKSFFPQLIAGPIVRYQQVADDFAADHASEDLFARGVSRFIIGLAKKVIIADNLAPLVDSIFRFPTDAMSAELAWLGALAFGLQIYFDFSGYSDMAIGLAAMFGIRFPENFRHPYVATSIQDFWRRWHISLSTWFRDYLYIPLGGSRCGPLQTCANLFIVFALCGLWHGASWAFLAWGLFHGAFLALERTPFGSLLARAPAPVQHGYVIVVVLVGWAIFRSPTLDHALGMLSAMAGMHGWVSDAISHVIPINPFTGLVIGAAIIGSLPLGRFAERFRATVAYEAAITATLVVAVAFVASQTHLAFIYFRF